MIETWRSLDAFLIANGVAVGTPTPGQTTGGKHSSTSGHPQGRSRDYGNGWPWSDCVRIVEALSPYVGPNKPIEELYYTPTNTWFDSGVPWANPPRDLRELHKSHVHVTLWRGKTMPTIHGMSKQIVDVVQAKEEDMVQFEYNDGAIIQMNAKGEVFCPQLPGRPTAKHHGGMTQLRDDAKKSFSGTATVIAGNDPDNSQAGYTILDTDWGLNGEFWKFEDGVEKFFK